MLLIAALPFGAIQQRGSQSTAAVRVCREFSFEGRANGGEPYSRQLGGGLWLRFSPMSKNQGWLIEVQPGGSDDDYGFPLNPPFHLGNSQWLATGYGLTIEQQLKNEREIFFSPTEEEYKRATKFYDDTVGNEDSPESATKFLDALPSMISAVLRLKPLQYETTNQGKSVSWMRFSITVVVPKSFQPAPGIEVKDAACPSANL